MRKQTDADLKAQGGLSNEEIPYEHSFFHGHGSVTARNMGRGNV